MAPGPEVLDFRIDGVGPHHFTASWRTSSKCACRIQISTSRAMVAADAVPGGEGTQFTFDSRGGDEYGHLPSMARYWVRVLAEDGSGRECAGPVTEVRLPT